MAGQEIVKEHFSSSRGLQNESQNIPLQGVLIFCCHKCHILWHKTLNKKKIERYVNISSDLVAKTGRKREKQAVTFGKTTCRFEKSDPSF